MLSYIDVLVDGPFIIEKKNIMLKFRGSTNQRVIDLKKTLKENKIILFLEWLFTLFNCNNINVHIIKMLQSRLCLFVL